MFFAKPCCPKCGNEDEARFVPATCEDIAVTRYRRQVYFRGWHCLNCGHIIGNE